MPVDTRQGGLGLALRETRAAGLIEYLYLVPASPTARPIARLR